MATGYVVTGRGDLDTLFKARTSAAGANTGFQSNGGVDLAQRFEPRGATTAIANTNFKAGANDLASVFMDIAGAPPLLSRVMVAGVEGGVRIGWRNTAKGYALIPGSSLSGASPDWVKGGQTYTLTILYWETPNIFINCSHATVNPPDNDSTWASISCTGVFVSSGGATVTRTLTRASRSTGTPGGTTPSGAPNTAWVWGANSTFDFISGNSYTVEIT